MGRAARPLHDPGNHRAIERGSNLQAARRGGLIKPAKPAEERENTAALTPSLGARPPNPFHWLANDSRVHLLEKSGAPIHVVPRTGAQAKMVQAYSFLHKTLASQGR